MATVIDDLLVNLGFDADTSGANRFDASLSNVLGTVGKFGAVIAGAGAIASGFLGKALLSTASEFEKFETQLTTIEGSSEKAKESLDWISEFAKRTPYDIAGVTDAFVKLKAYGLDPASDGLLTSLGNTASAMGKTLDQSIEMIADAVRGESERLKEFGIVGSKNKNEMTYSYTLNGESLTKTVENDAVEIQKALQEIFDEKFAGGMDAMSMTWEGQVAKMGDIWTAFKKRVSERGIFDRLKYSLGSVSSFIENNEEAFDKLADTIGDKLVKAFDNLESILFAVWDSALYARDAFQSLDARFGITEKAAFALAGILALLAANMAGLFAAKIITGITSLASGFMLLFNPLALAGVALLGFLLVIQDIYSYLNGGDSLIGSLMEGHPELKAVFENIIATVMRIIDAIKKIWTDNQESFAALFTAIGGLIDAFKPMLDLLLDILPPAFALFLEVALVAIEVVTTAVGVLADVFTAVVKVITVIWKALWSVLSFVFDGFFDVITNKIKGLLTIISGLAKSVSAIFNGDILEGVKIAAKATWDGGKQVLSHHSDDYLDKKRGASSVKSNQTISSTMTQHINVASASEAVIVANRTAQATRQQSYGYQ